MRLTLSCALVAIASVARVLALQVTPGSSCAAICLDDVDGNPLDPASSSTNTTDIKCMDESFDNTEVGMKYKTCLDCLRKSEKVNGTESDSAWFLYNLRFAVDVCLWGFPGKAETASSPCNLASTCGPLESVFKKGIPDPSKGDQYGYCAASDGSMGSNKLAGCRECLRTTSNQAYLANFLTALEAGCQQRPEPGTLLALSGSPFTRQPINITAVATTQPSDSADSSSQSTAMPVGTIVGIATGCGLVFFGALALFVIHCRRQRKFNRSATPNGTMLQNPYAHIAAANTGRGAHHDWSNRGSGRSDNNQRIGYSATAWAGQRDPTAAMKEAGLLGPSIHIEDYSYMTTTTAGAGGRPPPYRADSNLPAHPAYRPYVSSSRSVTPVSTPPPSQQHHPQSRSHSRQDSYPMQTYQPAAHGVGHAVVSPGGSTSVAGYQGHGLGLSNVGAFAAPPEPAAMAGSRQRPSVPVIKIPVPRARKNSEPPAATAAQSALAGAPSAAAPPPGGISSARNDASAGMTGTGPFDWNKDARW